MAQSLSFFGNRRGSTKSHTYQVNGGLQITKDRVDEVKNPRTNGQMVHRCCLHTLSDAHAYLRPFIGRFWEGARSPQAALAAFRKANYPIIRSAAESDNSNFAFSPYKVNTKPIGMYQISKGSLGDKGVKLRLSSNFAQNKQFRLSGAFYNNLSFYDNLAKNGLKVGDKFYLLMLPWVSNGSHFDVVFIEFEILDPGDKLWSECLISDVLSWRFLWGKRGLSVTKNINTFFQIVVYSSPSTWVKNDCIWGCITQRRVQNKLISTDSYLNIVAAHVYWPTFQQAIATYPQGGGNVLDGGSV